MNESVQHKELAFIRSVAGLFPRHPQQVNGLFQADAEIIRLTDREGEYLVLKTDGIHEEIRESLYEDPYLIGWMTATAPVSDLAAVGAAPFGLLLSLVLPSAPDAGWLEHYQAGIQDACRTYGMHVLGGDTNFDSSFSASATAVAWLKGPKPLLRTGMQPGDYLYASASLGLGGAYAYYRLFDQRVQVSYQPRARLDAMNHIGRYASACMDTSDGLFPALSVLSEINGTGFDLTVPLEAVLHPAVALVQQHSRLPSWMFLAGPHGEYELLFTVPEAAHQQFAATSRHEVWQPQLLGRVIAERTICFSSESLRVCCAPATIPHLFEEAKGNIPSYFERLLQQHATWAGP